MHKCSPPDKGLKTRQGGACKGFKVSYGGLDGLARVAQQRVARRGVVCAWLFHLVALVPSGLLQV